MSDQNVTPMVDCVIIHDNQLSLYIAVDFSDDPTVRQSVKGVVERLAKELYPVAAADMYVITVRAQSGCIVLVATGISLPPADLLSLKHLLVTLYKPKYDLFGWATAVVHRSKLDGRHIGTVVTLMSVSELPAASLALVDIVGIGRIRPITAADSGMAFSLETPTNKEAQRVTGLVARILRLRLADKEVPIQDEYPDYALLPAMDYRGGNFSD